MSGRKCYICEKPLDDEVENFVIRFNDESFDLCKQHYQTSRKMLAYIDKRKKELEGKICCKNYGEGCEYDSAWFCKNPDCITPIITSTLVGAHPSVCPSYEMCIPECEEGYNAQIAEYKRLLKAAINDIYKECSCNTCGCDICEYNRETCDYDDRFTWRHKVEALKLLEKG